MSILVYTESENGTFKKSAFEVASYAKAVADQMGTTVTAVAVNVSDVSQLGTYGVDKVLNVSNDNLKTFNAKAYASVLEQAAKQEAAKVVVLGQTADSKYLAPVLAVKLDAGYASNVVAVPTSTSPFTVKRTAFTNKAFNFTSIDTEDFSPSVEASGVTVDSVDKVTDKVTIADADIVVSAGRGLKGPENWAMVEELADVLGAATACSKPVSDLGWRPHSEHVGQTGKPVASNLYIAIGISGAIQHLAGINASKVKVVINTDPEAPFFKAADYGVVGDAFEVVPQLIEKLKAFKAANA